MTDADKVRGLQEEISACRVCVDNPLKSPLPHEPRPVAWLSTTAKLCIAGQAPGLRVHKSGIPFDDRSGDRLRDWMGVDRETFYDTSRIAIAPMGFCFPGYDKNGSDLPPRRECAPLWREKIFAAMPQIELILVIGQYAQAWHLGDLRERTVAATVQNWERAFRRNETPALLPLPHPSWRNTAWLKRNPWFEVEVLPVLRQAVQSLVLE
ncbi:uracil-DNA glycosylase family protein [Pseudahrensia aquimaris]|uniref:Uracil-DNA glycosylase family protein n=1 Tax=Pseudahrensia aquimaris TaxID=744461 RepID=A0ABW3FDM1_9HYPH